MNAMPAIGILRWHGLVEPQRTWFDLAQSIVHHLIDEHSHRGSLCLPYTSNDGNACAWDLAGFYVWPAVVAWQEAGDMKCKSFALKNMGAAGRAFVSGVKQFNQAYVTGGHSDKALLSRVGWR